MRHLLAAALFLAPFTASAAEVSPLVLRDAHFDATQSEFVRELTARLQERHKSGVAPTNLLSDWEVTKVGNITYLRDQNGTHACSSTDFNTLFNNCITAALDGFYAANPTANPDFLATYLAWDIGQFFAFYSPMANDVRGIGMRHFAGSDTFGNTSSLEGFIFMNSVQLYDLLGPSGRQTLFDLIWGQEVGHRWGSFVHFDDHGTDSIDIQGRDYNNGGGHWSYYFDTDWSWMEGNDWRDNGDGTFTTDFDTFGAIPGYCPLDLYVMGLAPPSSVPDMWYIDAGTMSDRADPPQIMSGGPRTISGSKRTFRIDDVISAEGVRDPAWHEGQRSWQSNLLVVLRQQDTVSAALQATMTEFEGWTSADFGRDTQYLAGMDTTLGPKPANGKPNAVFTPPATAKKGEVSSFDASGSTDPDGDLLAYVWDFGDGEGAYGNVETVDHKFRKSGDLTVTLTVVDRKGAFETLTQPVTVAAADEGGFLPGCGCTLLSERPAPVSLAPLALLALGAVLVRRRS